MPEIPFPEVQIIGLFLQSIFYGIYLVSCPFCWLALLRTASRWRQYNEVNWILIVVSCMFFVIATLDLFLHLYQNILEFIPYAGEGIPISGTNWTALVRVSSFKHQGSVSHFTFSS